MKCVTISGKAGHGKDTFASTLKKNLEKQGYRVCIFHYADYIKMIAKEIYCWDGEKNDIGRSILQNLGDKLRAKSPRVIIDELIKILKLVEEDFDFALIPDARFPLEIEALKEFWPTSSVMINRVNYNNNLTNDQKKHITETAMDTYIYDFNYDILENVFLDYSNEILDKLGL